MDPSFTETSGYATWDVSSKILTVERGKMARLVFPDPSDTFGSTVNVEDACGERTVSRNMAGVAGKLYKNNWSNTAASTDTYSYTEYTLELYVNRAATLGMPSN